MNQCYLDGFRAVQESFCHFGWLWNWRVDVGSLYWPSQKEAHVGQTQKYVDSIPKLVSQMFVEENHLEKVPKFSYLG